MPDYAGYHVRDMFSGNEFPRIAEAPYVVTLTPHAFYWFTLERPVEPARPEAERTFDVQADTTWDEFPGSSAEPQPLGGPARLRAAGPLVRRQRPKHSRDADRGSPGGAAPAARPIYMLLLEVTYADASRENYLLPVGFADGDVQAKIMKESADSVIAHLRLTDQDGNPV